jgi:hypothetical protein
MTQTTADASFGPILVIYTSLLFSCGVYCTRYVIKYWLVTINAKKERKNHLESKRRFKPSFGPFLRHSSSLVVVPTLVVAIVLVFFIAVVTVVAIFCRLEFWRSQERGCSVCRFVAIHVRS